MNTSDLIERIRLGEDSKTEFKQQITHIDELAASVVCFANSIGGELILGVRDGGYVAGLENMDRAIDAIENVSRQNVEPPIAVTWEKFVLDEKLLLVIHVPRGPQRPYRTNRGVYYVRVGRSCRLASRQDILDMYQSAGALHADETTIPQTTPSDIDLEYLESIRPELLTADRAPRANALRAVNLMGEDGLTLGGLLCFGRTIQRLRPYARTTFIRFRGQEVAHQFEDREEIEGRLDEQYFRTIAILRKHLRFEDSILREPVSKEFKIPLPAVKEAIVNALVHRDYFQNSQIRVFLFSDRLEVISPGRLINNVTIEAMRSGFHVVRNPVIFSHFARLRLATDAGLGIPNMIGLTRASGNPEPEIAVNAAEVRITFRFE